jgi:hypothetical protein
MLPPEGTTSAGAARPLQGLEERAAHLGVPTGTDAMKHAIADPWPSPPTTRQKCFLVVLVSTTAKYSDRRAAIRATYLRALRERLPGGPGPEDASQIVFRFLLGVSTNAAAEAAANAEAREHGDMLKTAVHDCYDNLFPKLLAGYRWAAQHLEFAYAVSADDDAYIRLERLVAELRAGQLPDVPHRTGQLPDASLYYGYMWNFPGAGCAALEGGGSRTRPIRDEASKSFVPVEQWPSDTFPPFASGCCFVLSADLVRDVFVRRSERLAPDPLALRFLRLIDVAVGVALAGREGVRYVHARSIRPFRPLPLYQRDTTVQHYIRPEEFRPFHLKAYSHAGPQPPPPAAATGSAGAAGGQQDEGEDVASAVYRALVQAKVLRR